MEPSSVPQKPAKRCRISESTTVTDLVSHIPASSVSSAPAPSKVIATLDNADDWDPHQEEPPASPDDAPEVERPDEPPPPDHVTEPQASTSQPFFTNKKTKLEEALLQERDELKAHKTGAAFKWKEHLQIQR